ncbi:SPOR domain-containing protein [Oleiagrimonas soli]|uniref:Uncharacterized protein (DUF1501 family) n=1 Tax=Oleiagrimonas soli TaxID=1543381 RepID=A0A099CY06_9GAMM|nr:SPOR domain-containing protein [Oleiagrimonas soli]KGI78883.1 hypothetical protein LF63_0102875 [Oleiagrimonas soli]MBB6184310.1 uncharacterized protein (DUF1501 family) [Oleiagrimonas soli]
MFVRLLFLLLIALNVGVGAWLVLGDGSHRSMPAPTDPGVPALHLLSESGGASGGGVSATAAASGAPKRPVQAGSRCLSIGPFDTQSDTRDAVNALTAHVADIQYRQEQTTQSTGWWVYLPPLPSRDQALAMARQLSAKGVSDYYVVTAGDRQNTISLGLFHDPDNARRRQQQLIDLGFKPELKERTETLPEYWVDVALPAKSDFDWHRYLTRTDISAKPVSCF